VQAMWLMLQQSAPEDFVIATGESHSLQEFVEAAFAVVGKDSSAYVEQDNRMLRPAEILYSYADVAKAAKLLGWSAKNKMADVVRMMLDAEGQSRSD
jgi:GDPmannose 4,6-dehydratase